jgi:hypothetical protein
MSSTPSRRPADRLQLLHGALGALAVLTVAAALGAAADGCSPTPGITGYDCQHPDIGYINCLGEGDPCHCLDDAGSVGLRGPFACVGIDDAGMAACTEGSDGSADGPIEPCTGQCLPGSPDGWSDAQLLWTGTEAEAPPCPDDALVIAYEGYADLTAPSTCAPCTCAPPTGSCTLPATLTANDAPCEQMTSSTGHQPFDPPSPWDGTCTTHDAIPAAAVPCDSAPCIASMTIAPLVLAETECAPAGQPAPTGGPVLWGTFARACTTAVPIPCDGESGVCIPSFYGQAQCIYHEGDVACPGDFSPYSEKHVFYASLDDTRSCTPCSCGTPVGSACEALVSVYSDTCSTLLDATEITATAPLCLDVPPGSGLGSKAATPATYTPGVCQASGGDAMGVAQPDAPSTFCCLSSSVQ